MLRFPNQGSNLENFIKIFENISFHLSKSTFNLDDMVSITVEHGLASSSGFIGKEAIKQSTRDDRSRDSLFNQMKMYSELYRHNGWLKSSPYRKLDYIVTPFGLLLSKSSDKIHKFILSNLCISFPNESIETKSKSYIRPFFTLFKIIKYIDYNISRDEIICSILSIKNDYGKENHDSLIEKIKKIRSEKNVELNIKKIMEEDKLSRNTLNNYTRYPVMFLRDSGLFDKKKSSFFLNKEGKKYLEIVENSYD